jgi:hypothetical protein
VAAAVLGVVGMLPFGGSHPNHVLFVFSEHCEKRDFLFGGTNTCDLS